MAASRPDPRGSGRAAWILVVLSLLALSLAVLSLAACGQAAPAGRPPARLPAAAESSDPPPGRIHALLINGGSTAEKNYGSHLLHLRELIELLRGSGVPDSRIHVFASDGSDPSPDLAVRDEQPEKDFWLIDGLAIGNRLSTEVRLVDSTIDGVRLRPANNASITAWFENEASQLALGDTLLLYVTDHGSKNREDPSNNSISLWGEQLSVTRLRQLIFNVPQGVRVTMLMSQCYSGAFANVQYENLDPPVPFGDVCGFFSSTPERQAYGCYPENRGKHNVGHSFRFFDGIRLHGSFDTAHRRTLLSDSTPDVPGRTSDYYLRRLLEQQASRRGVALSMLVEELLEQAWRDEVAHGPSFAAIDRIGERFGSFGPRTLRELDERASDLPALARDLKSYARRWRTALTDLRRQNFEDFLAAHPFWQDYLADEFLDALDLEEKRGVSAWLLEDLGEHTRQQGELRRRLRALRTIEEESRSASYRMEVRRGAVLRMRMLLMRIAGEVYIDRHAEDSERAAYEALVECERFRLRRQPPASRRARELPAPFPTLVDEMHVIASVLPGYLGVDFRILPRDERERLDLLPGAVRIAEVYPHSPAAAAGLEVDDIVLGPPEAHFAERNRIREWSMTALAGETRSLDVLRDGHILTVALTIGAAPTE